MTKEDSNGIWTTKVVRLNDAKLVSAATLAAKFLSEGTVIAVPTDTVYGIAALVQNKKAVQKLYDIKGKPPPVIVTQEGYPFFRHFS
jgi:tRNA A37 threonylcarbamoyladenosine synthetase subunit TsaC/SUA5/YrdC